MSYFTHRRCFRGIWFFRFVARHQVSICRNILNQLQQSRAWVRTRPHMDGVVRHAQFHLGMTLNKVTNDTVEGFGWCNVPVNSKTAQPPPPGQSPGIWLALRYSGEFDLKWGPPGGAFDFRTKASVSGRKQKDFTILWFGKWAAFTGHCSCRFHVGFSVVVVFL